MEVCGVDSTTCGRWRQGASILNEVKPDKYNYLTGSTLSWKKVISCKGLGPRISRNATSSASLPCALLVSQSLGSVQVEVRPVRCCYLSSGLRTSPWVMPATRTRTAVTQTGRLDVVDLFVQGSSRCSLESSSFKDSSALISRRCCNDCWSGGFRRRVAKWFVDLSRSPQAVQQDGEFSGNGNDGFALRDFRSACSDRQAKGSQVRVLAEWSKDVLG